MNKLKRLPVASQVWLAFGAVCVILLIIGGWFFFSLRAIERRSQQEQTFTLKTWGMAGDINERLGQLQASLFREVLASDPGEIQELDKKVGALRQANEADFHDVLPYIDAPRERELYDEVARARKSYWEQTEWVMALGRENRDAETTKLIKAKQAPAYDRYQQAMEKLLARLDADADESAATITALIYRVRVVGDSLVALALLIVLGAGFAVAGIGRRLKDDNHRLQDEVTMRKQTEAQLRESEGKFRQLAENIDDVFWMTSPDLQQVLYASPAYEKVWGRSPASACEHPNEWSDAIVPEERDRVFATFARLMNGESSVSEEFRITRPSGEVRWIHSRGFQVRDAAGRVIRLTGIASDITARKKFEAQIFQSQKLETVGKLSGGIAHEFNSILTAILGHCEMLLTDLPSGSPSAKSATAISQAAGRAATLTRQLLAYGRKQFLQPETLDLNKIVAGMEGVFRHLMGGDVTTQIVPGPGLQAVKADAGQIEQVIMNMVINARDAMPNGGKLTMETANVSFDADSVGRYPELKPGKYVMLAITDTGAGMSEQVKARLFEPFFTTKGVGEGTGLGLSSCYGIIKQSGGHISVYSEPGRGTTFKVYLPQVEQPATAPVKPPSPLALPCGMETILLVEDDPALREMAETMLTRLGYKVWAAANGIEALSLKQQRNVGHIDLLFTDVVMPHMSGKELADRVRSLHPHTRILFTSAYTENASVHQGVLDKGAALLQKPYTPSALAHKLREVLDQGRS